MYPVLFKIGHFELHSWGAAFAVAFLTGVLVAARRSSRFHIDRSAIFDFSIVVMISALIGSRFWYVVFHISAFKGNWLDVINPFQEGHFGIAGMSMMGGIVFAILASFVFAYKKKISLAVLGDCVAPSFLLGAGIQRLGGCFLNGCCFGRPTESWMGIIFPPEGVAGSYFPEVPLWPTQLFASALGFIGFIFIVWVERWRKFPGYIFYLVLIYYSISRFIVDQFRYYESEQTLGTLGPFTFNVNHILLLCLTVYGLFFWIKGYRQHNSLK
jgi:phosphatidylglycerol:prolipoprotein diacylglycerol transferase